MQTVMQKNHAGHVDFDNKRKQSYLEDFQRLIRRLEEFSEDSRAAIIRFMQESLRSLLFDDNFGPKSSEMMTSKRDNDDDEDNEENEDEPQPQSPQPRPPPIRLKIKVPPQNDGKKFRECGLCDFRSRCSKYLMGKHRRTVHPEVLKCDICEKMMRSKIALHVHYKTAHSQEALNCELCAFVTRSAQSLRIHIKHCHVENGPFQCEICEKEVFGGRRVFKNHLKLHTNDKDYICVHCAKGFVSQGRLNSHNIAVHREKKYQCEFCSAFFATKFSLERHSLRHEDENVKTYDCQYCGYSTIFMGNLTKHVRNVHRKINFRAGIALKGSRKVLGSSEENYRDLMERKSKEITRNYLKEFSAKTGMDTSITDLKLSSDKKLLDNDPEIVDRVVEALIREPQQEDVIETDQITDEILNLENSANAAV